jgi:hypothetical protein
MQTLTCALGGHEWVREGRGRPPKNCPEHQTPAQLQYAERHRVFYVPRPKKPKDDAAPFDPARGDMGGKDVRTPQSGPGEPLPTPFGGL